MNKKRRRENGHIDFCLCRRSPWLYFCRILLHSIIKKKDKQMKTPKRNHKIPTERQHLDIEPDSWEEDYKQHATRWKRKNRVAQLKRSLRRYKGGNFLPWYSYERHAYMLIQRLRIPSDNAGCIAHQEYTRKLFEVVHILNQAIEASSFRAGHSYSRQFDTYTKKP